ncbi:MAG: KUP/HAK/KT family potassium transporter [Polyangiaceae bacterium]
MSAASIPAPPPSEPIADVPDSDPKHGHAKASLRTLAFAALGVVYGDIGTSPLYALKECIHGEHALPAFVDAASTTALHTSNVLGVLSLFFWAIVLVVSVKYLTFIMRADNEGEGGILALLALIPEKRKLTAGRVGALTALIIFGACLLYGDGVITPSISVLSAVEGLQDVTPTLKSWVIPITIAILVGLFAVQKRGTATIGKVFGPVMLLWFLVLGVLGTRGIILNPGIARALNPLHAIDFMRRNGFEGFKVLGSVVLCITGGEALYADMGHFGRRPIQWAWYGMVLPCLVLNYFGQGALLIAASDDPEKFKKFAESPFFSMVPSSALVIPLVILATLATIIASQALISGAYSLTHQAVQLGFLPRVTVTHTSSETEGQIYIPEVNWALAIGCVALVLGFKASSNLAAAYGIAVTGTMGITSIAFYVVARRKWGWSVAKALPLLVLFLSLDLAFFGANLLKFIDGGFVPIVIALGIFAAMITWKRGRGLLAQFFMSDAVPLESYVRGLADRSIDPKDLPAARVPGAAVFLTSNPTGTPPLLLHHVRHNKALHETVLLVTVTNEKVPRVTSKRVNVIPLAQGFYRITIRLGYMESPDVPRALHDALKRRNIPFEPDDVTYYLGRETLLATKKGEMGPTAESIFAFLTKNSQRATRYFSIPAEQVVEIGMQVDL